MKAIKKCLLTSFCLILFASGFMGAGDEEREHQLAELSGFNQTMKTKYDYDYWNPLDIFILKWWGIIGEEIDLEGM